MRPPPARAESFSAPATHLPGEPGIWVLIGGDLGIFALFFGTYLYYQGQDRELFAQSQLTLSQSIGIVNTGLLLTSSWFVARAVQRIRASHLGGDAALLLPALLCGAGFVVNKGIEWAQMIREGQTLLADNFYMFFFMLTGIHAAHVLIGIGVLAYVYVRAAGGIRDAERDMAAIESGAVFWHLVDLLWVVLFALFYLVR
jgi:nitric oxide reductase NorE protein